MKAVVFPAIGNIRLDDAEQPLREQDLDEAIDESFPASDPPSISVSRNL